MIYLDNASTTRVSKRAFLGALPYMIWSYGNPSSNHKSGFKAKKAIEKARKQIANAIGTTPEHIIFTSGGTEANNLALQSAAKYLKDIGKTHVITTNVEHSSVKNIIKSEFYKDFDITYISTDTDGDIALPEIMSNASEQTGLISMMGMNNETGVVFPFKELGEVGVRRDGTGEPHKGILFHCDFVQAFGNVDLKDIDNSGIDFLSVSGHKIHALKGVGFLYVKNPVLIQPLIIGGGQESNYRSGTENVAGIVSLGIAVQDIIQKHSANKYHRLWMKSVKALSKWSWEYGVNCSVNLFNSGKILSVRFDGVDANTLVLALSNRGVCVSAGSACNSQSNIPSMSLMDMGLCARDAMSTIRISFSKYNTTRQVKKAMKIICKTASGILQTDIKSQQPYLNRHSW